MQVLYLTALLFGCAIADPAKPKIVAGEEATPHEFPYMVSLQWMDNPDIKHFCGGALLSRSWVLTAAHCIYAFSNQTEVVAGAHSIEHPNAYEQRRKPHKRFIHKEYSGGVAPHDIGLVKVNQPFKLNIYVNYLLLPSGLPQYPNGMLTISGWGSMSKNWIPEYPDQLMKAELPVLNFLFCITNYPDTPMHVTNICAGSPYGSQAICSGDSGSPLVKNKVVYGVTSWTWYPCGQIGATGVFVNVSFYLNWIYDIINRE